MSKSDLGYPSPFSIKSTFAFNNPKFQVPKAKKESWNKAVQEAEKALSTSDNHQRFESATTEYIEKAAEKSKKETEKKKSKRKSILPSSITYRITPYKELNYRESDSTYDADLYIPEQLWNQENIQIPAEIVTGPGKYVFGLYNQNG